MLSLAQIDITGALCVHRSKDLIFTGSERHENFFTRPSASPQETSTVWFFYNGEGGGEHLPRVSH